MRLRIFAPRTAASQSERGARKLSAVIFAVIKGRVEAVVPKVQNVVRYRNRCVGRSIPCNLKDLRGKKVVNRVNLQHLAVHRRIALMRSMCSSFDVIEISEGAFAAGRLRPSRMGSRLVVRARLPMLVCAQEATSNASLEVKETAN
jgi:hypothetical protein